ncbi:MAG: DNA polymerase III subunit beta [Thermoanaerobaculaceae bacterium]|jgi:DNA polymerase-3 subunit beta|nr:DNA polymerase III subunit beta [Thermoanaerobaculaceae bacterium]
MDVTLNRAALFEELQLIQGVLERRTTIPILSNILLTAEGDRLHLAATDLDVTVFTACPATVRAEGRATIHGKMFFDLVRSLALDTLDVTVSDARVEVRCGTFNSHLASLDPANYPTLPEVPMGQGYALEVELLHRLVDATIFAVSSEEGHFQYNAALLLLRPDAVSMVATDGHRLAYAHFPHAGGPPPFEQQLLPRKILAQLRRLDGQGLPVYVGRGESHVAFQLGERVLLSRILEARFPQYERVLVRNNPHRAQIEKAELAPSLHRVALLASERTRGVQLQLEEDRILLTSVGYDLGGAEEVVPCRYRGPSLKVLVNAQYLLDFLNSTEASKVELQLGDGEGPLVAVPVDLETPGAEVLCVIMPIRA